MPGDSGFPPYVSSRINQFFSRAGKVTCLGSPDRNGSVSILGSVNPTGGDFSDPVVTSTLNTVDVLGFRQENGNEETLPRNKLVGLIFKM